VPTIHDLETLISDPFHVPIFEGTSGLAGGQREPSQESDVAAADLVGASQPQGPVLVDQLSAVLGGHEAAAHALAMLWQRDNRAKRIMTYRGSTGFTTTAQGNVAVKLFEVPTGYVAYITHAILEVVGKVPGSAVVANAFAAILEGEVGDAAAPATTGNFRYFKPQDNASGLFLPTTLVDDNGAEAGWPFNGGQSVQLQIGGSQAGLANLGGVCSWSFALAERNN
jgi:hypothetical protein